MPKKSAKLNPEPSCANCALAQWETTKAGKLHPSGEGTCRWQMPQIKLPKSRYFLGWSGKMAQPSGGYINRHQPYTDCPQWLAKPVEAQGEG